MCRISAAGICILLISLVLYAVDEPVSPSRIALPEIAALASEIEIPEKIEVPKEAKPGMVGMTDEFWGERKSLYFGALEFDEKNGMQYIMPLTKEETKGKKHYEHIYHGDMLTEIIFRDEKGNIATDEQNETALIKRRYDKDKQLVEESSCNPDGTLKSDWYGFAMYRWEYNDKHLRIQSSLYDANSRLAKQKFADAAISRWIYDDNGNVVIWATYDQDGKPAKNIFGVAATQFEYDDRGRETMAATFGTDKKLANNKDGFAVIRHIFDDGEKTFLIAYYDKDLKPVPVRGACFERIAFGKNDKWSEDAFYDAKGNLTNNIEGAAIILRFDSDKEDTLRQKIYDANKNLISEWELDGKKKEWRQIKPENKQ